MEPKDDKLPVFAAATPEGQPKGGPERKPKGKPGRRWLMVVRRKPPELPELPEPPGSSDEANLAPEQCLNCGALVTGRYCAECGQEHSHKVVSLSRLLAEFLDDTFSLDSKLLKTTALLLFQPGFLTNEYNVGRHARYLSPWRMYVFTSVLLFFLLSLNAPAMHVKMGSDGLAPRGLRAVATAGKTVLTWQGGKGAATYKVRRAGGPEGPFREIATGLMARRYVDAPPRGRQVYYEVTALSADGRRATSDSLLARAAAGTEPVVSESTDLALSGEIHVGNRMVRLSDLPDTVEDYTAAQQRLSPARRDGVFQQLLIRRMIEYRNLGFQGLQAQWSQDMLENAPKAMFVLLPLFALLLKAIYIRRRRLYIEHLVFALHTHAFLFALLSVEALLRGRFGLVVFGIASLYLFLALRAVYGQSLVKTFAKFSLLLMAYTVLLTLALTGLVVLTFFTA
jgi:hypothetical protein